MSAVFRTLVREINFTIREYLGFWLIRAGWWLLPEGAGKDALLRCFAAGIDVYQADLRKRCKIGAAEHDRETEALGGQ